MRASTLVALRRRLGPWCTHSHPERDEDDPPGITRVGRWAVATHELIDGSPPKLKGAADPSAAVETDHAPAGTTP